MSKHLVLFLDIDGVLNSSKFFESQDRNSKHGIVLVSSQIDVNAIDLLNKLIEKTNANIVISSTWRLGHTIYNMQNTFRAHGFKYPDNIIGCTPDLPGKTRGAEIVRWLSKVPVDSFVVFDDDEDMKGIEDHFIKTDFENGLQEEHITRAINMFLDQI